MTIWAPAAKVRLENEDKKNSCTAGGACLLHGTAQCLRILGSTLGSYDLDGQVKGLQAVRAESRRIYESLDTNKDARLRSYRVLGICTGAALTIVLI